jgi:hypothetical protein
MRYVQTAPGRIVECDGLRACDVAAVEFPTAVEFLPPQAIVNGRYGSARTRPGIRPGVRRGGITVSLSASSTTRACPALARVSTLGDGPALDDAATLSDAPALGEASSLNAAAILGGTSALGETAALNDAPTLTDSPALSASALAA